MNTLKINLNKLIMDMLLLLPITTLFQSKIPMLNRALFLIVIISLLYFNVVSRHTIQQLIIFACFFIVYVFSFFVTEGPAENTNEYFYLAFFILYYNFFVKKYHNIKEYLLKNTRYLKNIVIIWNVSVIVSMFFRSSYNGKYFYSFTGNVFRSATAAIFILSLILVLVAKNRKNVLYAIVPLFCIFSGGSRTYLAIGLAIFLIIYYMAVPSARVFWLTIIPMGVLVFLVVLNSSIMDKIASSLTVGETEYYQDPLIKFTSGRSLFWEADIRAFFDGEICKQILGYGYNFVYDINLIAIRNRIWAHNDFINILLNYGYIGLICYLWEYVVIFKSCISAFNYPKWMKAVLFFIWLFNAFFNMFYTYSCACASYPLVLLGVSVFWEQIHTKPAGDVKC